MSTWPLEASPKYALIHTGIPADAHTKGELNAMSVMYIIQPLIKGERAPTHFLPGRRDATGIMDKGPAVLISGARAERFAFSTMDFFKYGYHMWTQQIDKPLLHVTKCY